MEVLFVTPEVTPFARAGGLGDVSHYLPQALSERGHSIKVITPRYRQTTDAGFQLNPGPTVQAPLSWRNKSAKLFTHKVSDTIEIIFIDREDLFYRDGLYGNEFGDYEDNAERFIFFCRSVMETIKVLGLSPEIIHCHDWPSGLVPIYVKSLYRNMPNLKNTKTVFTFHNLGAQGVFWHYDYTMTGLDWEFFTPDALEFHGQLNMTKAGLVFADIITTVSEKYAREALTPEYAFGLEGVLECRKDDTYAVLNGVDYNAWDPEKDPYIAAQYTRADLHKKTECRKELRDLFGLNTGEEPIVAVISRLLDRKGFDLISAAMNDLLKLDLSIVFMGMGDDKYHTYLGELSNKHPDRIGMKVIYDKALAHKIMAGADIFLMPSRYEPCGLEQLYSLKYGTIPVVRATGGLDDTVIDYTDYPDKGYGFKFQEYTPEALYTSLAAAVAFFGNDNEWKKLVRRGMSLDFSWEKAAAAYEKIYEKAMLKVSSGK